MKGSVGINTRTLSVSVRVGGSTPPDNTRLTCRGRVLRNVAFPNSNCRSQRWIKVFNPAFGFSDCNSMYNLFANKPSCRLHPRVQAPRHSPCFSVEQYVCCVGKEISDNTDRPRSSATLHRFLSFCCRRICTTLTPLFPKLLLTRVGGSASSEQKSPQLI